MTLTIVALSIAYAALGVVLLVMALRTPYRWWVKGTAITVTSGFFVFAFFQTRSLPGWPAVRPLPARFQLLWTRVVEPSRAYNEPGAIFLWVEELDENNVPTGIPRSYKLRYTAPLAAKVEQAKSDIVSGKPQEGTASDLDSDGAEAPPGGQTTSDAALPTGEASRDGSQVVDPEFLASAPQHFDFAPMPAPLLPVKAGN